MNSEYTLAKDNTTRDAYRNVFMVLCPDLFTAETESEIECPCNQPNPDDAGNCQNCGEVGIIEV